MQPSVHPLVGSVRKPNRWVVPLHATDDTAALKCILEHSMHLLSPYVLQVQLLVEMALHSSWLKQEAAAQPAHTDCAPLDAVAM